MAKKTQPAARQTVRELGAELDPAVYAGVCAAQGWQGRDQVTAAAFRRAVDTWLHGAPRGTG